MSALNQRHGQWEMTIDKTVAIRATVSMANGKWQKGLRHLTSALCLHHTARRIACSVAILPFAMFLAVAAQAATPALTVGSVSGQAGTAVDVPISFDPGTSTVSAIQFNLTLPAAISTVSVTAGSIVTAASKQVSTNLNGTTWTFLVFGLNQNTIAQGTLLTARVFIAPGTPAGTLSLSPSSVVYSDPNGMNIPPGTTTAGTLTVLAAPPPPPPPPTGSAPTITVQPQSQNVAIGQTATFSVTATGTSPLSYQWQYALPASSNFFDLAGATASTFTSPAAILTINGYLYRVIVSNSVGSVTSNAATLTVTQAVSAPTVTVGSASGAAGTTVSVPVSFDPGSASIAGMQFNVTLPTGLSAGTVTAGPILNAASKSVSTAQNGNVWTFIIFGLNQNTIAAGSLLTAQLAIAPGAGAGTLALPISGVVYTDPNGQIVAGGTNTGGSVTVTGGTGGSLPTPTLNGLPAYMAVNGTLTAGFPTGFTNITFTWTVTPVLGGYQQAASSKLGTSYTGSPLAARSSQAGASAASFQTLSNVASLGAFSLVPGYYTVTVQATNASGNASGIASKNISLVLADLSSVRVYPNPWRSDKHAGHPITFDQMALGATVKIFTVSGRLVKTLTPAVDTVTWDLTNDSGDKVASGLYIYLITVGDTGYGGSGQKARGKLAIIK